MENADTVTISPAPGKVDAHSGSVSVTPTADHHLHPDRYRHGRHGERHRHRERWAEPGNPQIIRFEASPLNIAPGSSSTLSWTTNGATTVTISGVGSVTPNGSTTVSPTQTTTYTLTASDSAGHSVTAPVTVTVSTAAVPQIVTFVATPPNIDAGQSTQAVLAGDGRDFHRHLAGRWHQSEC